MEFKDRVAIVTGGASGMGAATVRRLAAGGANVMIVDRNGDLAADRRRRKWAAQRLSETSPTRRSAMARSPRRWQRHGGLDVLVNAAGVIVRASGEDTTDEQWAKIMGVNVSGTFFMCRAALRVMKTQWRRSDRQLRFDLGRPRFGRSRRVLRVEGRGAQPDRALAMDHAADGIRVNAVCPGEVNTPMLQSERAEAVTDQLLAAIAATVPMGRLADPDEIARVVCFLASDDASYMTGAMVSVDAGYGAR